jgi:hypothetical protein
MVGLLSLSCTTTHKDEIGIVKGERGYHIMATYLVVEVEGGHPPSLGLP